MEVHGTTRSPAVVLTFRLFESLAVVSSLDLTLSTHPAPSSARLEEHTSIHEPPTNFVPQPGRNCD